MLTSMVLFVAIHDYWSMVSIVLLGALWLVSLGFTIENIIQLRTTTSVLEFTNDGIRVRKRRFNREDISDIEIYHGKDRQLSIKFHATRLSYNFGVDDLDVDPKMLEEIAEAFIRRWREQVNVI
jgi:hypothetical protein